MFVAKVALQSSDDNTVCESSIPIDYEGASSFTQRALAA